MTDPYLEDKMCVDRLITEWKEHKKIIIAYDFDNTVFDFHKKGYTYIEVINLLKKCREVGAYFIVFTSCDESKYEDIKKYLIANDLPFDKINENMEFVKFTGRKIFYNILLDDRTGLSSAFNILEEARKVVERDNQYINCTNNIYDYLKFLFEYKTKSVDVIYPDINLITPFELFMTAPVAIYKGRALEAVVRRVKSEEFIDALNKFSILYTVSKICLASTPESFGPVVEYRIRGVLKETFEVL